MIIKVILYMIIYAIVGIAFADDHGVPSHYLSACTTCHEQMVSGNAKILYTRDDRLARNYEQLDQRVRYCKEQLALDWNEEEVRTVVNYLAKQYYKYSPP